MSWTGTERYGLRRAPAGLALVQDLVNTKGIATYAAPDLLATVDTASAWATAAVDAWAETHDTEVPEDTARLTEDDPRRLRELRAVVGGLLAPGTGARPVATDIPETSVRLAPRADGQVEIVPVGTGSAWIASAVWSEVLLAQLSGRWPRLKTCRNEACASAFYDTSRNNSGVWHSVRTCGNAANLRASRARKRQREVAEAEGAAEGATNGSPPATMEP
ncbi:CGNR zinc finger domain-containing protein [Streptomyces sp. 8L]|uniref:CGNR zinc finger domain-containing protein n=1 Tax=Streptomyces sp. 8L TaxID=2877242 RepID=UPI001CD2BCBD|nr:CGNR zinc finger domain-containing protein [Streptomyces sp. 8L]MCA1222488.1 CGNR zinc finger domain-containing protein [Streptomyces sp. 8L]